MMRNSIIVCLSLILLCNNQRLPAQQFGEPYIQSTQQPAAFPWRPGVTATEKSFPTPPATRATGASVRLFPHQEKDNAAGTTNNLSDEVPKAPQTTLDNQGEQRPLLNTISNATDPDFGNLQQPSSWCKLGPITRLFGTTPRGTTIGGFAQTGYHESNLPYLNTRDERFNLHQLWTYIDRPAQRNCDWSLGYRLDAVYGIDGSEIQSLGNNPTGAPSGWDNGWDFGSYGAAMPQAYLELANCDWRVRVGRFLSPFGFEQVPSVENFFYSRSYTRFYTEPFGHTGVLAMRDASPGLTILSGVTAGWNTGFENTDNGFNYLGGIRYQPNSNVTLSLTNSVGDTGYRGSGILQSAIAQLKLNKNLTYVLQGDYLNLQTNDEFGITNYMFYCVNPCLSFGSRVEWWKSDQLFTSTRSTWEFTSGINYRPHANIVIRPEVRMDYGAAALNTGDLIPAIDAVILF